MRRRYIRIALIRAQTRPEYADSGCDERAAIEMTKTPSPCVLLALSSCLVVLVPPCIFHPSYRLHLGLNLGLPLPNLRIPLLVFLEVVFGPNGNLLYRRILFQEVEFRDSGLYGLMVFLVQLRLSRARGCVRRRTRSRRVYRCSIYSKEKRL